MARWSTVRTLLQGGPFHARIVRPDLPVRVLRLESRGVIVEATILGEVREVLVKVGGLRCVLPRSKPRGLKDWVAGSLQKDGPATHGELMDRALAEGVAVEQDVYTRVAAALGRLSHDCRIVQSGWSPAPTTSGRRRKRRVWRARA